MHLIPCALAISPSVKSIGLYLVSFFDNSWKRFNLVIKMLATIILNITIPGKYDNIIYSFMFGLLALVSLSFWLTKDFAFNYINNDRIKKVRPFLALIHIFSSLFIALFLPNNYLVKIPELERLFRGWGVSVPITMFIIFICLLISIGIIINLVIRTRNK